MLVVPSCKYHLPRPRRRVARRRVRLHDAPAPRRVGRAATCGGGDAAREGLQPDARRLRPRLAGGDRPRVSAVTGLIREAAAARPVSVGLKIFNAIFDDDFQLEMLASSTSDAGRAAGRLHRLRQPALRPRSGVRGHAGCRLRRPRSERPQPAGARAAGTLEQRGEYHGAPPDQRDGGHRSGRMAAEYLLRGASTFQMHTLFQLPSSEYRMHGAARPSTRCTSSISIRSGVSSLASCA